MNIMTQGILSAVLTICVIILFQNVLVNIAQKQAGSSRKVRFMDLIVTCEDESYSLSRLQMYLWTVVIISGYCAVFFSTPGVPVIPESLYILMGITFANTVASSAIVTYKSNPSPTPSPAPNSNTPPDFMNDIFFESPGSLDLPRTQMFIWTVVSLGVFVVTLTKSFAANTPVLPDISNGLAVLMGISNGAYLGAKAAKQ